MFSSFLNVISSGSGLQLLGVGLGFLAEDWGQAVVVKALDPNS